MSTKVKVVKVVRTSKGVKRVTKTRVTAKPRKVSAATQAKQAQNQSLVTIEDSVLKGIIADKRFLEVVPCLASTRKQYTTAKAKCGRCNRRLAATRRKAMNNMRSCIANLKGQEKDQFKKLLGAKKVRVYIGGGKGRKPRPITF